MEALGWSKSSSTTTTVVGTSGDDVLVASAAAEHFEGLAGIDLVSYTDASAGVIASFADPSVNSGWAAGDTYSSIEGLIGSDFADTLTGDSGPKCLIQKGASGFSRL